MKSAIHPKYYPEAKVKCVCGNEFTTGSTIPEINVEICSACHPFFTGEMRFVDVQGRVEKFQAKMQAAKSYTKKKSSKKQDSESASQKTLKEMLQTSKK